MARIYDKATITPSKLELLSGWVTDRPWFTGELPLTQLGAYRFDDPDGEVGIETFLLGAGAATLHVPLTYRATPLHGATPVGTTEHTELGTRYVYDACTDPFWATAVVTAVLTGGTHAEQYIEVDGRLVPRGSTATAQGSGTPGTAVEAITSVTSRDAGPVTTVEAGPYEITLLRTAGHALAPSATGTLTVGWPGATPAVLVGLRTRT